MSRKLAPAFYILYNNQQSRNPENPLNPENPAPNKKGLTFNSEALSADLKS
ncbi:hypothetical protein [Rufibacter roseolus]|uniref:hypothetical protein n=1 Tax=Rufibacter roseolus TaxID=2817375 RepID=UPI001B30CE34|nr:hypothetical protein [Rufibacter roseolus]